MIGCIFLGVYWCVYLFKCLSVGGYETTDRKLSNFVVQVIMQGVCVCLYVYMC